MENKLYALILLFLLSGVLPARSQDTLTCNARFYVSNDGNTVYFRAADSVTGVRHFWTFGDGAQVGFGNFVGVTHTYSQPGTYTVIHLIQNLAAGCYDSSSQVVTIGPPPGCGINFWYSHDSTRSNRPFYFYAIPYLAGATQDTVSWTINDTLVGVGDTLHRFLTPGRRYTVCASLVTNLGCRSQTCQSFYVTDSVPAPPDSVIKVPPDSIPTVPPDSIYHVPPPDSIYHIPPPDTTHRDSTTNGPSDSSRNFVSSYPNPANNVVGMNVQLDRAEMIYVRIYNSMGSQVQQISVPGVAGGNHLSLPVSGLQSGIYYIQVQYGNETKRSRMQKL